MLRERFRDGARTFPVGYRRDGDRVTIGVALPQRKVWWRNLLGEGAPVRLRIRGADRAGHAVVRGDERSGVTVEVTLDPGPGRVATDG